jgi:anti-sigma regulatory factor (Ser/Thr protein kinase)
MKTAQLNEEMQALDGWVPCLDGQLPDEIFRTTDHGKLCLTEAAAIPTEGELVLHLSLEDPAHYAVLRERLQAVLEGVSMSPESTSDFLLAAGEAATNAIRHAVGGRCAVYLHPERVIVRVTDSGTGICPEYLSAAIFRPGFSTADSLGMGYTIMLQTADRISLATGPGGTVVQLEKRTHPAVIREPERLPCYEGCDAMAGA